MDQQPPDAGTAAPIKPTPIVAMRMTKMAVLPGGRFFDLTGLKIGYVVEGKRGEEWRALQWNGRLCIFDKPKLAAAFISGRNRPKKP